MPQRKVARATNALLERFQMRPRELAKTAQQESMPTLVNALVAMQGSSLLLGRTLATLALQATIQGLRAPHVHRVQLVTLGQLVLHLASAAL